MKKTETLIAKSIMSYNRRVMQAGEVFLASVVDAEYLIRRGQAQRAPLQPAPDPNVIKTAEPPPVAPPAAAEVAAHLPEPEVKDEAAVETVSADLGAIDTSAESVETPAQNEHDVAADAADTAPIDESETGEGAIEPQRATPARVSHNQRGRRR